jgi:hypothetical protein
LVSFWGGGVEHYTQRIIILNGGPKMGGEKSFTDEMKKHFEDLVTFRPTNKVSIDSDCVILNIEELAAILARLEAAERYCRAH